jgi:hypothetical protein
LATGVVAVLALHALGRPPRDLCLGWGWFIADPTREEGPTLIKDYSGTPTAFGVGFRDHLRELHAEGAN